VVAADGTLLGDVVLPGAPLGGITLAPGAALAVTRSGELQQLGDIPQEVTPVAGAPGRVRVFSWRVR